MNTFELDWQFSWIELAEMAWWEENPNGTEDEFESWLGFGGEK